MELVNKKTTTLNAQNTNNHQTRISSILLKLVSNIYIDQFVVTPVDKTNGNFTFLCNRFYVKVQIKELGIGSDAVSNNSDTYNMHDINDQLIINQHSD